MNRQDAKDAKIEPSRRLDRLARTVIGAAVEALAPIHKAQLLSYLKATGCHLGLLINFNVPVLRAGVQRVVLS